MSEREEVGSDVRAESKEWEVSSVRVNSSKLKVVVWWWELGEGAEFQMRTWNICSRLRVRIVGD